MKRCECYWFAALDATFHSLQPPGEVCTLNIPSNILGYTAISICIYFAGIYKNCRMNKNQSPQLPASVVNITSKRFTQLWILVVCVNVKGVVIFHWGGATPAGYCTVNKEEQSTTIQHNGLTILTRLPTLKKTNL
jgi:hypothetical protein